MVTREVLAAVLGASLAAATAQAGVITYQSINNDADCGISTANTYVMAVGFGTTAEIVNGVSFAAVTINTSTNQSAQAPGLASWTVVNGSIQTLDMAFLNPVAEGQALRTLYNTFSYNNGAGLGAQQVFTLDTAGMVSGMTYDQRLYIRSFVPGDSRVQSFAFTGDGSSTTIAALNMDDSTQAVGGTNNNQPYYINYQFTWDGTTTPSLTITPSNPLNGYHSYAMSVQAVPEPAALAVIGVGMVLAMRRRRA